VRAIRYRQASFGGNTIGVITSKEVNLVHSSPALAMTMFQSHRTADTLEALQNLLYLIDLDASSPTRVRRYVKEAEIVVKKHFEFAEYPC
jgi:hypothetical protein